MKEFYKEAPQVLRDFLSYTQTIKGKSQNTVNEYFFDLRTFFRFMKLYRNPKLKNTAFDEIEISDIGISFIREITISDLYEFFAFVNVSRSNAAATRARKVASIRSFFKYLETKANLIDYNPAKDLDSPKLKKSLPKYLSLEESIMLLEAVDDPIFKERDYAMITLLLNCGMRLSELVGINLRDIKKDTLRVLGKGNKERTIYLNPACIKALEEYLKRRPVDGVIDRDALFISKQKKRISGRMVENIIKKYLEKAGLDSEKYSVHKLRHTAATLMYKHGNVDIRALQEILGHENLATTEIYTHVDSEQLKQAVNNNPLANI